MSLSMADLFSSHIKEWREMGTWTRHWRKLLEVNYLEWKGTIPTYKQSPSLTGCKTRFLRKHKF